LDQEEREEGGDQVILERKLLNSKPDGYVVVIPFTTKAAADRAVQLIQKEFSYLIRVLPEYDEGKGK
jgi:hypothetical protein